MGLVRRGAKVQWHGGAGQQEVGGRMNGAQTNVGAGHYLSLYRCRSSDCIWIVGITVTQSCHLHVSTHLHMCNGTGHKQHGWYYQSLQQ